VDIYVAIIVIQTCATIILCTCISVGSDWKLGIIRTIYRKNGWSGVRSTLYICRMVASGTPFTLGIFELLEGPAVAFMFMLGIGPPCICCCTGMEGGDICLEACCCCCCCVARSWACRARSLFVAASWASVVFITPGLIDAICGADR
jgi:hypothetical protein